MKNNSILFILSELFCTIFKIGNFKYMPGTLGSIVGIIMGLFIKNKFPITFYILVIFLICLIAIIMINIYQTKVDSKEDHSEIIIDEFIGQQIPLFFIELTTLNILFCFIFFRFFDILKVFPANYIDRKFKNSYGIIADDLVAGLQALVIIYLINLYI